MSSKIKLPYYVNPISYCSNNATKLQYIHDIRNVGATLQCIISFLAPQFPRYTIDGRRISNSRRSLARELLAGMPWRQPAGPAAVDASPDH